MSERFTKNTSRLHLGSGHLEKLPEQQRLEFSKPEWLNLGSAGEWNPRCPTKKKPDMKGLSLRKKARRLSSHLARRLSPGEYERRWAEEVAEKREQCSSARRQGFYFNKGDRLPFDSESFSFIFSEHFFEHLFMDEAFELFKECWRILAPGGVMRVSVPDADLRTYASMEPPGINQMNIRPYSSVPWTHPGKHKTRWNIYSLSLLLELSGYKPIPVVYCDKYSNFVEAWPGNELSEYGEVADREAVHGREYVLRGESLIVDGVKQAC